MFKCLLILVYKFYPADFDTVQLSDLAQNHHNTPYQYF